jgi:hypothetical protein
MTFGQVIFLWGLLLWGAITAFLKLSTPEQRERWFLNMLVVVCIVGAIGFAWEVVSSRGGYIGF